MVLLSFSIPDHIPKIKDGRKGQTTRTPRKLRSNGKPAYSVGEKAQLYYKSRQTPLCSNCLKLNTSQCHCPAEVATDYYCIFHSNFFGESEIIDIVHYHHGDYKERYHEVWTGYPLALAGKEDMDAWAKADGFPEGYIQAHDWFKATTNNPNWADQNLDVIIWGAQPIIKRWQPK